MITKEDFEAWRDGPVTEAIFAVMKRIAAGAKDEWMQASWQGDKLDPILRASLKAKEETYTELTELTFEDFNQWQTEQG